MREIDAYEARRLEGVFFEQARIAGLEVIEYPEIQCREPVKNSHGQKTQKRTVTDGMFIDYEFGWYCYGEFTCGDKSTGHKRAQRRVVKAAKIQNYAVVTKTDLDVLVSLDDPLEKLDYFHYLFGWSGLE